MKMFLILFAFISFAILPQIWQGQTLNPPYRLNDVDFQTDVGMAVGEGGAVFMKNSYLQPWTLFRTGSPSDWLNAIDMHGIDVWMVGENGMVLRWDFSSQVWTQRQLNTSENLQDVLFVSPEIGYIVGFGSTVFKTTDAGQTWVKTNFNLNNYGITSIAVATDLIGILGSTAPSATESQVLITTNGGLGYFPITVPYVGGIYHVSAPSAQVLYAAGEFGLLKSTNGGVSWLNLTPNLPGYAYPGDMFFYDNLKGVVVLNSGIIYKTSNGGLSWDSETIFDVGTGTALGMFTNDLENISVVGYGAKQAWTRYPPIELTLDSVAVFAGDTVKIPLRVSKVPAGYHGFSAQIYLNNFSPKLQFIGVKPEAGTLMAAHNWSFYTNQTAENLRFISYGSEPFSTNGILCYLQFKATPPDPTKRDSVFIRFDSAYFNTNNYPVITNKGKVMIKTRFPGDVDLNGVVQAFDASMVLRYLVGAITLDPEQLGNAEVTNNTTITAADASTIAQYVAGLIPSLPWGNFPDAMGTPQMVDVNYQPGQVIEVPVYLNETDNIYTLEGKISYDVSAFQFEGLQFNSQFSGAMREINPVDGEVNFAIAALQETNLSPNQPVMKLRLSYLGSLNGNSSTVTLSKLRLNEGTELINAAQSQILIVTDVKENLQIPIEYGLDQNFPNPFNPSTVVRFAIPEAGYVSLNLYDLQGEVIAELHSGNLAAGYHYITVDATKLKLSSGVYLYKLTSNNFTATKKLVLMK
ncbi:MAG: T9SS type A sorting domain-containing protein [Ignavibacteriaceae bacterium]|nr:T9SS type A sorting domain-containing protein [Ignavibacteriaceae bacterium]